MFIANFMSWETIDGFAAGVHFDASRSARNGGRSTTDYCLLCGIDKMNTQTSQFDGDCPCLRSTSTEHRCKSSVMLPKAVDHRRFDGQVHPIKFWALLFEPILRCSPSNWCRCVRKLIYAHKLQPISARLAVNMKKKNFFRHPILSRLPSCVALCLYFFPLAIWAKRGGRLQAVPISTENERNQISKSTKIKFKLYRYRLKLGFGPKV